MRTLSPDHKNTAAKITVLLWLISIAIPARADTTLELFSAINSRLAHMQSVADYKETFHLPVEDLAREAIVLEEARLAASAAGLLAESVVSFFATQVTMGKIIQYRRRADLLSGVEVFTTPDLENVVRPALDALGSQINQLLARRLQETGSINESDWALFAQIIDDEYLDSSDERQLFDSLLSVRAHSSALSR